VIVVAASLILGLQLLVGVYFKASDNSRPNLLNDKFNGRVAVVARRIPIIVTLRLNNDEKDNPEGEQSEL
jgi:hypothetical protein